MSPPLVDGVPDAGRADLLQMLGQVQLGDLAGDGGIIHLRRSGPMENNVVKAVDGAGE